MLRHSEFVFVAVLFYHEWPKIMLRSLREHFSEEVILVNHLPGPVPSEYYDDNCTILESGLRRTHGAGIDTAVKFLKNRGDRYFIHIEPDCLISGRNWAIKLIDAIASGAIMAGSYKLPFGPIHPCPTAWDISRIPGSFDFSERASDINLDVFDYAAMAKWFVDCDMSKNGVRLWSHLWDCGIKNWYDAALKGLAVHVDGSDDFQHFFAGRSQSPKERLNHDEFSRVERFL